MSDLLPTRPRPSRTRSGRVLALTLVAGAASMATLAFLPAPGVTAQQRQETAPTSAQISTSMGELRWGMTKQEFLQQTVGQIRQSYRPQIAKAPGAIEQDALHAQMRRDVESVTSSYVEFNGNTRGWDLSFLRSEYTHNNRESMIVIRDQQAQNYYFFIQNRLWKWYRAFHARAFDGYTFAQFAQALQGRYGPGLSRRGRLRDGGDEHQWIEWQDESTRLRAIDQTQFYGFYCLVFENKSTLEQLPQLRRNREAAPVDRSNRTFVDQVTSDTETTDRHSNIVDRITGRNTRRDSAHSVTTETTNPNRQGNGSSSMRGETPPPPPEDDHDPLEGL